MIFGVAVEALVHVKLDPLPFLGPANLPVIMHVHLAAALFGPLLTTQDLVALVLLCNFDGGLLVAMVLANIVSGTAESIASPVVSVLQCDYYDCYYDY